MIRDTSFGTWDNISYPASRNLQPLTLRELEALSCFFMTEFLTLNRTGITFQQTGCFQCRTKLRIQFNQDTGNTEHCSFSLPFYSATCCIDLYIKLTGSINRFKRTLHLVL